MIEIHESKRTLSYYRPVPLTDLPLIYHREHLFPYTSYGDTETTPTNRDFRMVVLQNKFLRIEVAPELGGRVYSLFDKRIGQEILFSNPIVKPVRILPIWAFISGGIEFNFPIAHSPTSIELVSCTTGQTGGYGFIRIGEREARTGMEWVVELGLDENCPALIQRTLFRNQTRSDHPWMSWTICALRSTDQTEFVHPPHRVLVHDDRIIESDWPGEGLNWDRNHRQMTALFWKPGSAPAFGAFHHDLGHGLMHQADPAKLPGKKLWTYGHGTDRAWAEDTTSDGLSYCEIESGPLFDQSEKPMFRAGTEMEFEEWWIPLHTRDACEHAAMPSLDLPPMHDAWLGWKHSPWQTEWENFISGSGPLPSSVVPTGLELESALRNELERGNLNAAEPFALWLAFRERAAEARNVLANPKTPSAHRIAGLIEWKALNNPENAVAELEAGPLQDPIAVIELDQLYAELKMTKRRIVLLKNAKDHRLVIERRAALALECGDAREALRLLEKTKWQREHQRYVRTELWKSAKAALGEPFDSIPNFLNEDHLARFGAYWSD